MAVGLRYGIDFFLKSYLEYREHSCIKKLFLTRMRLESIVGLWHNFENSFSELCFPQDISLSAFSKNWKLPFVLLYRIHV